MYGPIVVSSKIEISYKLRLLLFCQVPQLWQACLPNATSQETLQDRITLIGHQEAEKNAEADRKAANAEAIKAARAMGKEALALEKARIAREKAEADEAKKVERERLKEAKKAEKARIAAEKKAQKQVCDR